jgi:mannose-6-phosphate isomerase-like protein (cupin superfamily)
MNREAIVSDKLAAKFKTEKETPYSRFISSEGLDLINGNYVPSLHQVELKPWARRGGSAVFMNHDASRTTNDCYVMEIPAGDKLNPHRQLFEETVLILSGRGSTVVWDDRGAKVSFEWGPGSIFGIPLNANHQHFNGSGSKPARYIGVTNMPPLMNVFEEPDFIFGTK